MSSKSNAKLQFSLNVINVKTMGSIMALGLSSLFMFMYFSFIIALHNYSFMVYGSAVHVAAFAIIGYIATMFYLIAEGIAGGMQPPVSYYYGKKQITKDPLLRSVARIWVFNRVLCPSYHWFSHLS
ncbi:hypothetical protein [Shewanella sp. 10N.286.48.B5]|uniref:hypothetical protein n=1 Tax=Shewanella sp. 10N.286.48.B5 TaxID=1880834 RepID=UPI0039A403B8